MRFGRFGQCNSWENVSIRFNWHGVIAVLAEKYASRARRKSIKIPDFPRREVAQMQSRCVAEHWTPCMFEQVL